LEKLKVSEEIFFSGQLTGVDDNGLTLQFSDFSFLPRTSKREGTDKKKSVDVSSATTYWNNRTINAKDLDDVTEVGAEPKRRRK
jgi:hypothetical protein